MNKHGKLEASELKKAAALIVAAVLILFLVRQTGYPILSRHDERVGAYVLDVVQNGNWIIQKDSGGEIAAKPPLLTWCAASVTFVMGRITQFAIHLPAAVSLCATALVMLVAGGRFSGFAAPGTRIFAGRDSDGRMNITGAGLPSMESVGGKSGSPTEKVGAMLAQMSEKLAGMSGATDVRSMMERKSLRRSIAELSGVHNTLAGFEHGMARVGETTRGTKQRERAVVCAAGRNTDSAHDAGADHARGYAQSGRI